jgi:hypothetical protein
MAQGGNEFAHPTPEEFWSGVQPELLMIGACERASIASFKRWLLREVD